MPWCFGASQSVRASSIPRSAWWALVFHTFCPLTTHSSPSSTAVVVSPARSEPAEGSLNSWHHTSSPVRSGRRKRSRARSGPCSRIVGPARPAGTVATAPHRWISRRTTSSAHAGRPRPCHLSGQDGTAHPASTSCSRHARSESVRSQWDATQVRTSALTASTSDMDPLYLAAAIWCSAGLPDSRGEPVAVAGQGCEGPLRRRWWRRRWCWRSTAIAIHTSSSPSNRSTSPAPGRPTSSE